MVVEKVKETAAAAERDLVVRVEEKVERLEEKLGGKGSASASAPGGGLAFPERRRPPPRRRRDPRPPPASPARTPSRRPR